jgi:hypothetical protein
MLASPVQSGSLEIQKSQASTSFSEEKEAKRLLLLRALAQSSPQPAGIKSFLRAFF